MSFAIPGVREGFDAPEDEARAHRRTDEPLDLSAGNAEEIELTRRGRSCNVPAAVLC